MRTIIQHLDDKFHFGKFQGSTLGEVLLYNPHYLNWVVENVNGCWFVLEDSAVEEIKLIFPDFPITEDFEDKRLKQKKEQWTHFDFEKSSSYNIDVGNNKPTYERYNGSYAQDEMGFSDDEIDTLFDGDPLAYWNID